MRAPPLALAALLTLLPALVSCKAPTSRAGSGPRLVHSVYFSLREDTPERRMQLIRGCYENLLAIDGVEALSAGPRDESLTREANDQDYAVALTIVFRDRAALDRYLPDARHLRLIETQKDNLAKVRVFDSLEALPRRP